MSRDYTRRPEADRFWEKVNQTGECWLWTGGINGTGYGVFMRTPIERNGKFRAVPAHRFAYELLVGPIPPGLHVDHLCRVTSCVNPDHLEPVTVRENTLRGIGPSAANAAATHCKYGHEFTPENTWTDVKRNSRHCRTCSRRRWHEWNERRSA
jgi:hypothetical protein